MYASAPLLSIATVALMLGIFIIDAFTMLDVAIAVLYVAVVLLSVSVWRGVSVVTITVVCMLLTVLAYVYSHGFIVAGQSFARCMVSLVAIAVTAVLALRSQRAHQRLLERERSLQLAQAELAHVARVSTLGELAASIAHEVNQPLAAIAANAQAALRWMDRPQPELGEARAAIDDISRDAQRTGGVIRRVLALSRKTDPQHVPADLHRIVEESVALVRHELQRQGITLSLRLDRELPPIRGDRVQLQQVIVNLVLNAVQAMQGQQPSHRRLRIRAWAPPEGGVRVSVSDTGAGIDPKHRPQLFEAFFTTKPEGLGMGLPICRSIIEAHGGRIWADDTAGPGATLQFSLPAGGA